MSAYYIAYMTAHTSQAEYNGTCGSSTERGENSPDALCKLQVSITYALIFTIFFKKNK